jgi:hypothetical protein
MRCGTRRRLRSARVWRVPNTTPRTNAMNPAVIMHPVTSNVHERKTSRRQAPMTSTARGIPPTFIHTCQWVCGCHRRRLARTTRTGTNARRASAMTGLYLRHLALSSPLGDQVNGPARTDHPPLSQPRLTHRAAAHCRLPSRPDSTPRPARFPARLRESRMTTTTQPITGSRRTRAHSIWHGSGTR